MTFAGYPNEAAVHVAVSTVRQSLEKLKQQKKVQHAVLTDIDSHCVNVVQADWLLLTASCVVTLCGLRGCKNRAHCISWPEVVKGVPNQGADCSVS